MYKEIFHNNLYLFQAYVPSLNLNRLPYNKIYKYLYKGIGAIYYFNLFIKYISDCMIKLYLKCIVTRKKTRQS